MIPIALGDVNVNRKMPSSTQLGNTFNVSLEFKSSKHIDAFDVVEFLPYGWEITNWTVYGYNKNSVVLENIPNYQYQGKIRTAYHWSFREGLDTSQVLLVYTLKAKDTGSQEFITVWTYPGGFKTNTTIISVVPGEGVVYCGNGVCELGETSNTCPQDCPKVKVKVMDITPILTILAAIVVILTFFYIYSKYIRRIVKIRTTIEDLRAYIKLGLTRGYKLRELVNTLRGEGIDTTAIEEIVKDKEIQKLEKGTKKVYPESKVIKEIKRVVESLSKEDMDSLYKELGIKRIGNKKD